MRSACAARHGAAAAPPVFRTDASTPVHGRVLPSGLPRTARPRCRTMPAAAPGPAAGSPARPASWRRRWPGARWRTATRQCRRRSTGHAHAAADTMPQPGLPAATACRRPASVSGCPGAAGANGRASVARGNGCCHKKRREKKCRRKNPAATARRKECPCRKKKTERYKL